MAHVAMKLCHPTVGALLVLFAADAASLAQEPALHARVNELTAASPGTPAAALVSDAEFLRRVSLDLIGVPPDRDRLAEFLAEQPPDKRAAAVDRLLADPLCDRHLTEVFDVMLMERRGYQHVTQDEWQAYLLESFRNNKPWNQLAREILAADGAQEGLRAASRFYLDRGSEPNLLTRDVGRIFFGRDMQCAQCHDHPLIDDYLQPDYHGLYAFLAPGYEMKIKEGDKERAYYAERAGGDVPYESVFIKGTKHLTGPRVPGGVEITEPVFLPGEEYEIAPADNTRPVPKFSRRAQLAALATDGSNRAFNENIANRLWSHMMGRGLVDAPDLHHSGNPPRYPELLQQLGEQFAADGFQIKPFLRELALTEVYQRSIDVPAELLADDPAARLAELEAARGAIAQRSSETLSAYNTQVEAWSAAEQSLLPAVAESDAARNAFSEAVKKHGEAQAALTQAQTQLTAKQDVAQTVADASAKAQEAVAKLTEDQELAAAAQKFAERSTQLAGEVAALQKAVEEKMAAMAEPTKVMNDTRATATAAQEKVAPLREAVRTAEQQVLAARSLMTAAATALAHHDQQIELAQQAVSTRVVEADATTAAAAIVTVESGLSAAIAQVAEYGPVVTERQSQLSAANEAQKVADTSAEKLVQEHTAQTDTAQSVAAAFAAAETARQKLPEDEALKTAAETLKGRSDELAAALAEHQTVVDAAAEMARAARSATNAARTALDEANAEMTRRNEAQTTAQAALAAARTEAQNRALAVQEAQATLVDGLSEDFAIGNLRALTPEQLCWSILHVTGVYDRYRQGEIAELDKATPLSDEARADPAQMAQREREIEQRTYDKLKGNVGAFVAVYGAGAGQPQGDFFATADQALFAANGGSIVSWVSPAGDNVTQRIVAAETPDAAAQELYRTVLSRDADDTERAEVAKYLAERPEDRAAAAKELVWALIASAEFRFNH